jgi:hypothetical protein
MILNLLHLRIIVPIIGLVLNRQSKRAFIEDIQRVEYLGLINLVFIQILVEK